MCILSYSLFGEVKRKRCKDVHVSLDHVPLVNWQPPMLVNHFAISPTYTVFYKRNIERSPGRYKSILPRSNKHSGEVSHKAARKIRYCFNWLIAASKVKQVFQKSTGKYFYFKLNFITLTLPEPQKHSDKFFKDKILSSFIQWLQRKHGVVSYIWKAETQVNGNIHFHITTNKFIHWRQIRHKWNSILYHHGYGQNCEYDEFCKLRNSTDVHCVKKPSMLIAYMVKYFTKRDDKAKWVELSCPLSSGNKLSNKCDYVVGDDGLVWMMKRKIEGRLWYHSNNLFTTGFSVDETEEAYNDWRDMLWTVQRGKVVNCDFASIIPTRRVSKKEMPISVQKLLQAKVNLINLKDKHQPVYNI